MIEQLTIKTKKISNKSKQFSTDPFTVYLDSLSPSGRRSMNSQLMGVLKLMEYNGSGENFPWSNLRYVHLVKLRTLLQEQGKTANTVNTTLAAIKGVIRTAFNLGEIAADDYLRCNSVKQIKSHSLPVGRSLKPAEIKKLISVCKRDKTAIGIRDTAIIALMLSTGLRRSEVIQLDTADFIEKQSLILIRKGKGNRQHLAVITVSTRALLNKWLKQKSNQSKALFTRVIHNIPSENRISAQSIYNIINSRAKQAGLDKLTPHDLRRTLVTRLLDKGIDLNTVRQIIGHQNIHTTARYDRRDDALNHKIIKNLAMF